ncbi:MAG: hypothetical protein K0S85_1320 [Pseudomonas orientalis]|nr:hypothetical protein [Pseudomonas orientalis]
MPAVFIDRPGMVVSFIGSTIACSGVGIEVKNAAGLNVDSTKFYGQEEPVIFDGGGDLSFENNQWIHSTAELEKRPRQAVIYSPRAIQWMVDRIVERHLGR